VVNLGKEGTDMAAIAVGDEQKLKELILYISQQSSTDPKFGSIKLNKILYLSDFIAFGWWGEPITAVEYQHLKKGPAPRRLLPVRDEMVAAKELAVQPIPLKNGNTQKRPVNLRDPDLTNFSGREISLVDTVIRTLWKMDAEESSEYSHRFVGWKMTKEGENIPYGTIFLSDEPLSEAEIIRGQELAQELNLTV
jgi:hypothetical protein